MKQKKKIRLTVDPSVFSYEVLEDSPLPCEVCCVGIDTLSQAKRGAHVTGVHVCMAFRLRWTEVLK